MRAVEFGCSGCGRAVECAPGASVTCKRCTAVSSLPECADRLEACLACGCEELYRHRDFNQKVGLLIIVLGAVAWLVTGSFWPMVGAAVLDLVLYFFLPDVAICYRCKAHHRDFSNIEELKAFDLERHEHWRFVRARDEGRLPPRQPEGDDA